MGKRKDAIREVYKDCIDMKESRANVLEAYDRGIYIQSLVILSILEDHLGEDYDYGN